MLKLAGIYNFIYQIGPQTLVLGDKALKNGLGISLLQRLHDLYYSHLTVNNPYTG